MGERDDRPEWGLRARADGAVAERDLVDVARVPGALDLDEERALHEEMHRRRADPPSLEAGTEAVLRAHLLDGTFSRGATPPRAG